jgi:hypothetical protein
MRMRRMIVLTMMVLAVMVLTLAVIVLVRGHAQPIAETMSVTLSPSQSRAFSSA